MRKTTYSFHDPERPLRVHTVRGIFIIFSSGGALAAWGRRPRSTPLRRAAEGRQARGRREARSRVRPCGTFCHHRGRAADSGGPPAQRRASARNHRKARGAWIRCRPRARNPTCGQRAPSWAANSAISDESTKNRRLLSDGLESLGQGPCPKGSRSGSRRFGKVGKSSRPPESGNSRSPSSTRWNTSSASLAHRLSGFIWCRVFTALFPPGSRAFGDEPRPNDCRTNDCRTNDSFFLARESLSVSVFNLFFVVVAFSLFFPCFPRAPSSWRGFPPSGRPAGGKRLPPALPVPGNGTRDSPPPFSPRGLRPANPVRPVRDGTRAPAKGAASAVPPRCPAATARAPVRFLARTEVTSPRARDRSLRRRPRSVPPPLPETLGSNIP